MANATSVRIHPRPSQQKVNAPVVLRCPSDKSLTHRAVMFAAMAKGASRVHAPLLGEDCLATIQIFRTLGVSIEIVKSPDSDDMGFLRINSPGWDGWKSPSQALDFANSGTTARLLLGVFAATPGLTVSCVGDDSLSKRPMLRVVEPLRRMGAVIKGAENANFLPITIEGRVLTPLAHTVDKASAQIKSALCLAALNCDGKTTVRLPKGSRNHTELLLRRFHAGIEFRSDDKDEFIDIVGPFRPKPFTVKIPADPSSAAFFAVFAALHKGLAVKLAEVLDNNTRDGYMRKLRAAGVNTESSEYGDDDYCEPTIKMKISQTGELKPFDITPEEVPSLIDEVPILAVLAAFSNGSSTFRGLHELRVKESDRFSQTLELLRSAGISCRAEGDTLVISGNGDQPVQAFSFDPKGDHRLAMAAAVLATRAVSACEISDPGCVKVSFPGFYDFLNRCGVAFD